MDYLRWNEKIAKHFFNPNNHDKRIWFSVKKELIEQIANDNNTNFQSFMDAIKNGPLNGASKNKVCSQAYEVFLKWKEERNDEYPPYIAYLALFVLAANHEDDEFSNEAYYPRLYKILNEEPSRGSYPSFDKMMDLWADLQDWTQDDKKNEWGEFYCDIYGNKVHVGILYYQVVLTKEDQDNLPKIFSEEGWDSDSTPTGQEILKALENKKHLLSKRTQNKIDNKDSNVISRLVERVLEELEDYNHKVELEIEDDEKIKTGSIVLCMKINETTEQIETYFRCKRMKGLPDEEFEINGYRISKSDNNSCISKRISNLDIPWDQKKQINCLKGYVFYYPGKKCKIFTSGQKLDVNDLISNQHFSPSKEQLHIIIHKDLVNKLKTWGSKSNNCELFNPLSFSGLKKGWYLFKIKGIKNTDLIENDIPQLSLDKRPKIHLRGGIPLKGNQFSAYAPPPNVLITGYQEITRPPYLVIDGHKISLSLNSKDDSDIFALPYQDIPHGKRIITYQAGELKVEKTIKLIKNEKEKIIEYSTNDLRVPEPISPIRYPKLPAMLSLKSHKKSYLLGEKIGEIIKWRKESLPTLWHPLWFIQFKARKKIIAIYLGAREGISSENNRYNSKSQIKRWKTIVIHSKKKIRTPDVLSQKKWKYFLEKVKNV